MNLDSYFGIHAKALSLREIRASTLAQNMVNANTPHYKAQDLDFQSALKEALSGSDLKLSAPNHISSVGSSGLNFSERASKHFSIDGNTVDKDVETMEFARNAIHYKASLSFLDNKIKSMLLALKGE
jgi:flagellar basal-body rod protein FlgB